MRKRRKNFDQLSQAKSEVKRENIKNKLIKGRSSLPQSNQFSRTKSATIGWTQSPSKMANLTPLCSVSPPTVAYYSMEENEDDITITDIDFAEEDIIALIDSRTHHLRTRWVLAAIFIRNNLRIFGGGALIKEWLQVHKGGHQGIADNYRPPALMSHMIKGFAKVVRNSIVQFQEKITNLMMVNMDFVLAIHVGSLW